jgi:hypothetical protein
MIVESMPKVGSHQQINFYIVSRLGKHQAPYIKIKYKQNYANILLKDCNKVYNFGVPASKIKIAQEWVINNKQDLLEYWKACHTTKSNFYGLGIKRIKATKDFQLLCELTNGEFLQVDFTPFKADFPDFQKVTLIDGIPSWPSGVDLDPDELYELGEAIDRQTFNAV